MKTTVPTLQEQLTTLSPADVLSQAKAFFARHIGIYAAFLEREGANHATFRGQGGEELVIGAVAAPDGTRVTGSTYLFDAQVARFFATLPLVEGAGAAPRTGASAA
ncbi:MAG TPA: hypothetical protein VG432_07710 [Gemmatimonadaceae bacterium]|nr:hypothetical protein [Gemmatimonadaceae bacterium]